MNTLIRTTLLALLCLTAFAARAMPCPMPALSAGGIAMAAGSESHCGEVAEAATGAHAGMNLGDCLAEQPALPQTPVSALAPEVQVEPAPPSHAPAPVRLTGIEVAPPARPPPGPALATRTSLLWSSTQRLLL